MARSSRAAAVKAFKESKVPYFQKKDEVVKVDDDADRETLATRPPTRSSPRNSAKTGRSNGVQNGRKSKGKAVKEESTDDDDDDGFSDPSSTSSEDSGDAHDDYRDPDSDAIDGEDGVYSEDEEEVSLVEEDSNGEGIDEDGSQTRTLSKKRKSPSKGSPSTSKKRTSKSKKSSGSAASRTRGSAKKRAKKDKNDESEFEDDGRDEDEDEEEEEELEDGRKLIRTKLVKAPKSSVPPGIIDPHTMQFLTDLIDNNDREWFARNDARYRHALKNWLEFVDAVQPEIQRGDWSIPELPAKELQHRIYRDVRFSNNKTPYKQNLAASFSRTGRKGPFAGYYLQISPGGRSLLAGGKWGPEKNDLATIRSNLLRNSKPLRRVINHPTFVKYFGPAKPDGRGKGKRCNVFGAEDALKVAPKIQGVDKTHKDIDLLKLRTIGVVYNFDDEEVLDENFKTKVGDVIAAMSPLVLLLNDMLHPQSEGEEDEEEEEEAAAAEEEEEEENDEKPSEEEKASVTAASGKDCEDPENDDSPLEEDEDSGIEGEGGIEAA